MKRVKVLYLTEIRAFNLHSYHLSSRRHRWRLFLSLLHIFGKVMINFNKLEIPFIRHYEESDSLIPEPERR